MRSCLGSSRLGSIFQAMDHTHRGLEMLSLSAMGQSGRPWRRWGLWPKCPAVCCLYFDFLGDHPKLGVTSCGPHDLLNGTGEVLYQIDIYFWNQQGLIGCMKWFIFQLFHRCPYQMEGISLFLYLFESFYHKWTLNFVRCFFCNYLENNIVFLTYSPNNSVNILILVNTHWPSSAELAFSGETPLGHDVLSFCILFDSLR